MVDKTKFDAGRKLLRHLHEVWEKYKGTTQPHDEELLLSHGLIAGSDITTASSPSESKSQPSSRAASVTREGETNDREHASASDRRCSDTSDVTTFEAATDARLEAAISSDTDKANACGVQVDRDPCPYYIFVGEDETDYTYGSAKMISATDGTKDCAAILLTMELSSKIQAALRSKREFLKMEALVDRARADIFAKEQKLFTTELRFNRAVGKLEKKLKRSDVDDSESLHEKLKSTRSELNKIREDRRLLEQEDQSQVEQLEQAMREHAVYQGEVDAILDNVFTRCRLLEPPEDLASPEAEVPVLLDTRSPSADISNHPRSRKNAQGLNSAADEFPSPESTEQIQYKLRRNIIERGADLRKAERDFDEREAIYYRCYDAYLAAKNRGEEVPSKSDFDMIQLDFARELTRDLIAAENAYEEAKVAAREGGVMHDDFQESNFVDDPNDGYRVSFEADLVATTDKGRVERWLEQIPAAECKPLWEVNIDDLGVSLDHPSDADSPSDTDGSSELDSPSDIVSPSGVDSPSDIESRSDVDVDEWDARLDSPFYSVSVVAEGSKRRKIDHWRATAGQLDR